MCYNLINWLWVDVASPTEHSIVTKNKTKQIWLVGLSYIFSYFNHQNTPIQLEIREKPLNPSYRHTSFWKCYRKQTYFRGLLKSGIGWDWPGSAGSRFRVLAFGTFGSRVPGFDVIAITDLICFSPLAMTDRERMCINLACLKDLLQSIYQNFIFCIVISYFTKIQYDITNIFYIIWVYMILYKSMLLWNFI